MFSKRKSLRAKLTVISVIGLGCSHGQDTNRLTAMSALFIP